MSDEWVMVATSSPAATPGLGTHLRQEVGQQPDATIVESVL